MRKMKDSGVEWIGEIPESWNVGKLGYFIQVYNGDRSSNYPSGNDLQEDGVPFITSSNLEKDELCIDGCKYISDEKYESLGGFKMQINDIIYCLRGSVGKCSINLTETQGTVASSLMGIRCKKIHPKFLLYVLKSQIIETQNNLFMNGTCAANLSAENVVEYKIPIIDNHTQVRIANYLDKKCAEIDALIEAKEKTNALLKEQRQSIIYEAVTKGLNPNVPMKDSGIEWIGDIPENWDVERLKYLLSKGKGSIKAGPFGSSLTSTDMQGDDVKVFTQRTVLDNDFIAGEEYISIEKYESLKGFAVQPGDVLITTRGTIGKTAVVPDDVTGILHPCLIKMTFDSSKVNKELLCRIFNETNIFQEQLRLASNATTIDVIYTENLMNMFIPIAPIKEQKRINDILSKKCEQLDKIIEANSSMIEKLKEYRKSIIFETVTGKVEI